MLTYQVTRHNNYIVYTRHDDRHRSEGPSMIFLSGLFSWRQYGQRHRKDGPCQYYLNPEGFSSDNTYAKRGRIVTQNDLTRN
jgi:hypothetical protein